MNILFFIKEVQFVERLGIMYLSGVLKKDGHNVRLLRTLKLNSDQIYHQVKAFDPAIFAYSVMTGEHKYYIGLNKKLKERFPVFSLFGGPHATFFPDMINNEGVDAVCIGEGEGAILELAAKLELKEDVTGIRNLWIKKRDKIYKNPVRELISDLDSIPYPDRELIYDNDTAMRDFKTKMFFTSRGCPYNCTYCFNHQYNKIYKNQGKIVRFRTVDNLISEILDLKSKYPMEFILFEDDTFLLKPKDWMEEFVIKYNKFINMPFMCNVRPNLINEWTVKMLKDAGCYSVWMGIECGDETISNTLLKREIKNSQIIAACCLLRKNKIKYATQNLIALPTINPIETDLKTLELNIKCRPDFAWSSIFYPYPKTDLGEYSRREGYLKKDFDSMAVTNKISSELSYENTDTKKQLERLHKIFGIVVEFPLLYRFVRFIIRMPLDGLYRIIFFCWYGYCFRIRLEKWKKTPREILSLACSLFGYLRELRISQKT